MAAKLGFEAIEYVLKKALTKKGVRGIPTIPGPAYKMRMKQLVDEMAKRMSKIGYDVNNVTEKQVQGLLDYAEAMEKQRLKKGLEGLGKKKDPFMGFTPRIVPEEVTASPDRIRKGFSTVMKLNRPEENQALIKSFMRRENAEFNSLNREQQKEIFDMFDTWAKRDIKPDPADFASGGIAGGLIKLAKLKKMFPRIHIDSLLEASRIKDPNKLKQLLNSFRKTEQSIDAAPSSKLFDFDTTGRRPNASGGIAGELHLNRPGYQQGNEVLPPSLRGTRTEDDKIPYLFKKIMSYDKDVMPEEYKIPGSGGYGSILRHAGNTALLKKHLSEKMEPYTGKGIADLVGAVGAFGGGTLHELTAESPIWADEKRTVDEALPFDVGPSKKLSAEFKEDMLANLYGALYGKTGIKDKEVLDRLIERLSRKDNWSEIFQELIGEQAREDPERPWRIMPQMIRVPTRNRRPWEPEFVRRIIDSPFSNKKLTQADFIKKMEDKGNLATSATEGSFAKGGRIGYESGREVLPQQEIYEEELEKRGGFTGDPLYYFLGPGIETLKYKWPRSLLKKMIDDYKDIPKERLPKDFGPSLGSGVNVDTPLRKYRKKKLSPMIRRKKRKTIEQEAAKGGLAKVLGV